MRILHLEDTASDAELVQYTVQAHWPECVIHQVANRADFEQQLQTQPDLILSDFNLGFSDKENFNGLEALRIARLVLPETPFVFLSGTIGEERAVDALHAGATDYVIKDRPQRLIPALERAFKDAAASRERAAAAEQLLRVQRLENIGMLAAGIAHDINNVLAPVLMGAELLRLRSKTPEDLKILASMEKSAARGAGLVRQILSFAHGVTGAPQLIQSKHLLRDMLGLIEQTFPKNINVVDEIEPGLWPIKVNPTQFHQVLLNLSVNARDAMPRGGSLTLRAANRTLDEVAAEAVWPGLAAGHYLALEVSDTGTGIPEEIREKIWMPFFTTKGEGLGTGIGLATVRGIIAEHQGAITFTSVSGHGTTFHLLLPAIPGQETETGGDAIITIPRGNGELLLVVDDDASIREIASATLTGHGYRVQAASDGTDAVSLFAMRSREFRLVVTDIDMPNLDGASLAQVVTTVNPDTRILLMSGSTDIHDPRRTPPPGGRFLAKPFSAADLLNTVHDLLATGEKSAPADHA